MAVSKKEIRTEMIGLNIYRVESLKIRNKNYTLHCAHDESKMKYSFTLVNDVLNNSVMCDVKKETAMDFEKQTGESFIDLVIDIFKNEIDSGKI